MTLEMKAALRKMTLAALELGEAWEQCPEEHHDVEEYPPYLPEFQQFAHDLIDFSHANGVSLT